ncbi:MAG: hypothetical protein ACFCAD_25955 [Pleurocapsa sp.]
MKIILQQEARNISQDKLVKNQKDLIALVNKMRSFSFRSNSKKTEV